MFYLFNPECFWKNFLVRNGHFQELFGLEGPNFSWEKKGFVRGNFSEKIAGQKFAQEKNVKIQFVVESGVCGSLSEFNIAGTGAVYIKASGGSLCFSPRHSGSRSESKPEDSVVTSKDKKGCKEECSSGVKF